MQGREIKIRTSIMREMHRMSKKEKEGMVSEIV